MTTILLMVCIGLLLVVILAPPNHRAVSYTPIIFGVGFIILGLIYYYGQYRKNKYKRIMLERKQRIL